MAAPENLRDRIAHSLRLRHAIRVYGVVHVLPNPMMAWAGRVASLVLVALVFLHLMLF